MGTVGSRRVSLSARGRAFILIGVVCTIGGLILGVVDLQRVGILLLVLPVPAWLAVRQSRAGLRVGHSVSPARTTAGGRAEVRLVLSNPFALGTGPLRITETVPGGRPLRFSVAGVRGRQRRTVAYPLPALRRGRYRVGPTAVAASDPFGLIIADTRSTDTAELIVQPRRVTLARLALPVAWRDGAANLSHSIGVGGSEDASVRAYRDGDDLRKIHWRSTARAGALMMRQEERPWHGESLVVLDTRTVAYPIAASERESAALEWAVCAAASICNHLAERGRRVLLVTGSGRVARDTTEAMLDLLAETVPAQRADVQPLSDAMAGIGRDASVFAVLAATERGSLNQLLARPRPPGSAVALLLRPWTFDADGSRATHRDLRAEADWLRSAEALHTAGWRVVAAEGGDEIEQLWSLLLGPTQLHAPLPNDGRPDEDGQPSAVGTVDA
ncbi:MAG: hypothetical protein JWN95_3056 [Frankiales bacterium]|nr:hypothetical protein [Frankiales bacterium]